MGAEGAYEPRGAVEYTGANARFLHVKYGCLCEDSKRPVDGWIHPTNQKTGEEITDKWIKVYKSVEGWADKLEWYERPHGTETYMGWKLHLSTKSTNYILNLPLNNGATKRFMFSARNMNFELPIEIAAWTDRKDGQLAVWLQQTGETILQYYKKGDMKDCPEPVQKQVLGGKMKWDWEATDAFLWNEMQEVIAPMIAKIADERKAAAALAQGDAYEPDTSNFSGPPPAGAVAAILPDDDIPF